MIRRIDPDEDRGCFVDAWIWETEAAPWYKAASRVFGPPTLENWIEASREDTRATFGVFDPDLISIIILTLRAKGRLEVDILAKPRCSAWAVAEAAISLRDAVFADLGASEIYCWVAKKNVPTRRLCATIGFHDTGLRLLRGQYRGRVVEWHRLVIIREQVVQAIAA